MGVVGDWFNDEIVAPIVDFIGDTVSFVPFVGDFLEDTVDFAYEEIHGAIHDVSQWTYYLIPAEVKMYIATIAAVAFPVVWWLPAVVAAANAADATKEAGGSDADMFKAAFKQGAITLVATKAGAYVGKAAGAAAGGAGAGKVVSATAAGAASGATRGAVTAALTDGDIGEAALTGAIIGAVSGAGSAIGAELSGPDPFAPSDSLVDVDSLSDDWERTSNTLTVAFNDGVEGFKELPPVVRDMLVAAGASAASQAIINKGKVDPAVIAGAVAQAGVSSQILKPIIKDAGLTREQAALVTNVVSSVIMAASRGTDPAKAINIAISGTAQQLLSEGVKKLIADGTLDKRIKDFAAADATITEVSDKRDLALMQVDLTAEMVDTRANELNKLLTEYKKDFDYYNETGRFTDKDTANKLLAELDVKANEIAEAKEVVNSTLENYHAAEKKYTEVITTYNKATEDGGNAHLAIREVLEPVQLDVAKSVVNGLTDGEFNPEEYIKINGLTPDRDDLESDFVDPHLHWLETGRKNLVSQKQYDDKLDETLRATLARTVIENLDTKIHSIEDINDVYEAVKTAIGNDLTAAGSSAAIDAANEHLDGIEARESLGDTSISLGEGVTYDNVFNGETTLIVRGKNGKLVLEYVKEQSVEFFDPQYNTTIRRDYDSSTGKTTYTLPSGEEVSYTGYTSEIPSDGSGPLNVTIALELLSQEGAENKAQNNGLSDLRRDGNDWIAFNPETGGEEIVGTVAPTRSDALTDINSKLVLDTLNGAHESGFDLAELSENNPALELPINIVNYANEFALDIKNPEVAAKIRIAAFPLLSDYDPNTVITDIEAATNYNSLEPGTGPHESATKLLNIADDSRYATPEEVKTAVGRISRPEDLGGIPFVGGPGKLTLEDDWDVSYAARSRGLYSHLQYAENRLRLWKELNPDANTTPYTFTEADLGDLSGEQPPTGLTKNVIDTANRKYIEGIFKKEGYTGFTEAEFLEALKPARVYGDAAGEFMVGPDSGESWDPASYDGDIYRVFDETQGRKLAEKYDPLAVTPSEVQEAYTSFGLPNVLPRDIKRLAGPYEQSKLPGRVRTQAPVAAMNITGERVRGLGGDIQRLQGGIQGLQDRQLASSLLPSIDSNKSTIKTPESDKLIDYFYDPITAESIFAPGQEDLFVDPYADTPRATASKGGLVEDVTDEIIGIIRR